MGTVITFLIALVLAALCAACARRISRRRPPAADPFSSPIGDVPNMPAERCLTESGTGYTARELDRFNRSAGRAAPADQGSGGDGASSQGAAAARPVNGRGRRAF